MKKIFISIFVLILSAITYLFGYVIAGLKFIPPHYHANFAVIINGEKIDFSSDGYMEDVAGCSLTGKEYPESRTHLHNNNGDTIHIHDGGVTWGHFFANNNIVFGKDFIKMDSDIMYQDDGNSQLIYMVNGAEVENPFNMLVNSEDKLLVFYGTIENEETLQKAYSQISSDAGEFNEKYDPGSCGGTNENAIVVLLQDFFQSFMHGEEHQH